MTERGVPDARTRNRPVALDRFVRVGRATISSVNFGAGAVAVVCLDSCALVKLVVEEEGSDLAPALGRGRRRGRQQACTSRGHRRAQRRPRSQRLDPTAERRAQRDWAELWSAAHVVELTAAVAAEAARLAGDSSSKVLTPSISRASSP